MKGALLVLIILTIVGTANMIMFHELSHKEVARIHGCEAEINWFKVHTNVSCENVSEAVLVSHMNAQSHVESFGYQLMGFAFFIFSLSGAGLIIIRWNLK